MKNTKNNRITQDMDVPYIIQIMCDNSDNANTCVMEMMKFSPFALSELLVLDKFGIYGEDIYILWNDSCDRNMKKLFQTIEIFKEEKFSYDEIHENLGNSFI